MRIKRCFAMLLVICMLVVNLPAGTLSLRAEAAEDSYLYNWGTRGTTATELSDAAEAFYADNGTSYETLAAYAGASDVASVPGSTLYAQLQGLMVDNHTTITTYDDTRDLYQYTDCQNGGGKISSFYSGAAIGPAWDSGTTWNREHVWPNSKGLEGSDEDDIMMLRPTAVSENTSRGNTAYGESAGYYHPNSVSGGSYDLRGDVARITLYVYTRWGNTSYMWGTSGVIESKDVLLSWMEADPVDTWELGRNDVVQSITGTRNVFVDYPELAFLLFNEEVPGSMTTPSGKAGEKYTLTATVNDPAMGSVTVSGKTVTAAAADGFYAHGFEVTSGTATVKRQGDSFLVTAFSDCTVQINFKAKTLAKISYLNNGNTLSTVSALTGDTITLGEYTGNTPEGYTFLGWSDETVSHSTDIPSYYLPGDAYGVTGDTKLYALFTYLASGGEGGGVWTLVTDAAALAAGQEIVFAYQEAGHVSGALNTSKHILDVATATFDGDTIASMPDSAQTFTLGGSAGAWTFSNASGKLLGASASKTALYFGSGTTTWTIAISGGNATITNTNSSYGKLQYNAGYPRFTNYTSSQQLPQIYMLDTGTEVPHYTTTSATSGGSEEVESIYYGRNQLAQMANAEALLYAYDQIVEGVENCDDEIDVYNGITYLTAEEFLMVEDAYIRDYAHHFWLDNGWGYGYTAEGIVSAIPSYLMTGTALETAKAAFNAEAAEILSGITSSMSDYEKELYIHDALAARIVYAEADNAHNAYGALVNGVAVCEGYAEAFQYLLHQVDIQSFLITGSSRGEAHAWNAVNIGGKWYHVDLTWNDQDGEPYHAYFNVTDARIQEDHVIDAAGYTLPTCNSEDAFYFTGKDTLLTTYTTDSVGQLLKANNGKVHVYVPSGEVSDFVDWFDDNILAIATKAGVTGSFSYGYSQLGRELILIIPELQGCSHDYESVVTAPTCTEKGYTTYTCTLCGDSYVDDDTDIVNHSFVDGSCTMCGLVGGYCGASTNEGGVDSVTWTLADGVLTISGNGNMEDFAYAKAPWYSIAAQVKTVTIQPGITGIGNYAFFNCTSLTSVTIPNGVTIIGEGAFNSCSGLVSITIPDSVTSIEGYAFAYCSKLKNINIPNGGTSIGEFAFYHCTSLPSLTIPASVTSIGDSAFFGCSSLTGIWVDAENVNYSSDASGVLFNKEKTTLLKVPAKLSGSYAIPDSVTGIANSAFYGCINLTNVTIPSSVTSIGKSAFDNCTGLTKITLPTGLTRIEESAFSRCTKLKSITIPDGVTSIGKYAFSTCTALTDVTIPVSVTSIDAYAFGTCTKLSDVYYGGTEAQWQQVTIGEQNYDLEDATIHFTDPCAGGHAYDDGVVTTEPTCTAAGVKTFTCGTCGDTYTEEVSAKGHNYESVVTAPTCTEKGYTTYTCTVCGDTYTDNEVAATGHDYKSEVVAPTTEAQGYTQHTCSTCGDSYKDNYTDKLPVETQPEETEPVDCQHNWQEIYHEEVGHEESMCVCKCGYRCKTSAEWGTHVDSYSLEDALLYHTSYHSGTGYVVDTPAYTEWVCSECGTATTTQPDHICGTAHFTLVQANDATCTAAGNVEHYLCSCGKMYADLAATQELTSVTVAALGHSASTLAGYAPTCTVPGKTDGSYCARCSTVLEEQSAIPALEHDPVTDAAVAATCTTSGKTEGSHCDRCNAVLVAQETIDALGHTEATVPAVAPTCTAPGLTEGKKCSVCNEVLTAQTIVAALGHSEVIDAAVAATCQNTGLTEGKHCEVCNAILVAQTVVEKLAHTEEILPAVAPTCTTTGLTEGKKCSACGETILAQTVVDALGHTPETIPAVAPTCTATGLTEGSKCGICGMTLTAQTIVDALGHTEEIIPAVAPTCTATGLTEGKKCTVCGITTVAQTTVPATGHAWNNGICGNCGTACDHSYDEYGVCTVCGYGCTHDYDAVITAPTCTEQGYTTYTCNLCGNTYNGDYVDAKGHSWTAATCTAPKTCTVCGTTEGNANGHNYDTVVTAPTCTGQGYTTHTCTVCGDSYTDTYTDETGHTADVPVEANRVEATCTEKGSYETVTNCAVCGEELSRVPGSIPAKGHSYTDVVTEPTCTEQGYTTHSCTACGDSYTDSYTPATGHSYGEWETVTDAACTAAGEKKQTCICGDVITEEIPAKGHSWITIDATTMECTVCGETQSGYRITLDGAMVADATHAWVDGKKYPITSDGTEAFVSVMHTDATNLVIYSFNDPDAADPHSQYPTGMRVWMLKYENGAYTATYVPEFDNLLQYSGSSIRIVGVKGIRMITSIDKDTRNALINGGLAGYTLLEYGTALAWASDLDAENPLILGREYTKSNFAYKRGEADPIFNRTGNLIQYTNVLVGFDDDQCIPDIVMRPYIILEDEEGNQVTIYGGEVVRNIGYIAWQNRLVFNPGNAAYDYVWNIIHHVYGDVYDEDYKG